MPTKTNAGTPTDVTSIGGATRRAVLSAMASASTLTRIRLYCQAGVPIRVAVYQGDNANGTGTRTLVEDLGQQTPVGTGMVAFNASASALAAGKYPMVEYKAGAGGEVFWFDESEHPLPDGDVVDVRYMYSDSDPATPFPSTSTGDEGTSLIGRVPRVELEYAEAGGPELSAGPVAANVSPSGFDIQATSVGNATASLLVTAAGADQPSDSEFDASGETTAALAGVPFTIHHTNG